MGNALGKYEKCNTVMFRMKLHWNLFPSQIHSTYFAFSPLLSIRLLFLPREERDGSWNLTSSSPILVFPHVITHTHISRSPAGYCSFPNKRRREKKGICPSLLWKSTNGREILSLPRFLFQTLPLSDVEKCGRGGREGGGSPTSVLKIIK